MNILNNLLNIPSTDPDNARKGKLLNIILAGMAVLLILVLIFSIFAIPYTKSSDLWLIFGGSSILLVGMVIVYFINKLWSGRVAATTFLILLTVIVTFSDDAVNISTGQSLFIFTIPIIMASVLLAPTSSFIFSTLSSIIISVIAISIDAVPNIPAIGGYFVVALISWLSARSLEQALKDLRVINAELDQRVVERTQELSEALSRETLEAGRREAILNSIADGVVVFDKSGVAILANPSISSLINKPQEKIIGRGLSALLDSEELQPAERTKIASRLQESAQDLSNFRVEWGKRTLSVNAAEVTDDNNQSIGIVAVLRDFTHEAELEKMKNTFVAIVSHELRTPLNAILGYAEMLKESVYGSLNEKQQGASIRIMTNTQRLLTIVSDLLDQAQIEAGRLKIQMVPCRPADLVDNLHSVMDKIASDKGLELITELESSMPPIVLGDPQRLQQILVNLVNNAVKFTEKGHINVRVYNFNKDNWRIQVMDTGNGIPDDAKDYIFESFRQVEGTSTRQHGGVGLGLSIIKQLVELMNGNIEVESEPGKGSIFTVTLPLILQAGTSIQTLQRK